MQKIIKANSATTLSLTISLLLLSLLVTCATSLPTAAQMHAVGQVGQASLSAAAIAEPVEHKTSANVLPVPVAGNEAEDVLVPLSLQPVEPSVIAEKCASVGQYCKASDECCTKRCLTFAAKCVT